jgi:hypothetical protein
LSHGDHGRPKPRPCLAPPPTLPPLDPPFPGIPPECGITRGGRALLGGPDARGEAPS